MPQRMRSLHSSHPNYPSFAEVNHGTVWLFLCVSMWHMILTSSLSSHGDNCRSSHLPIPSNITVVLTSWVPPAVRVTWHFPVNLADSTGNITTVLTGFQLAYRPVNAKYRVVYDISPEERSLTLSPLLPRTEYQLYLAASDLAGLSNISNTVHFISPDIHNENRTIGPSLLEEEAPLATFTVREEEVVIVVLVLAVWVFVLVLFFNKWGKIRMLEPYQPQYHSHPVIPKPARIPLVDSFAPLDRHLQHFEGEFSSLPGYSLQKMRPRQNSVFVGSPYRSRSGSVLSEPRMPRKVKSAEDIKSLVVQIGDRRMRSTVL